MTASLEMLKEKLQAQGLTIDDAWWDVDNKYCVEADETFNQTDFETAFDGYDPNTDTRVSTKDSAKAKLKNLGLTDEEVTSLIGG